MIVNGKVVLEIAVKSQEDCRVIIASLLPDERDLPQGVSSTIKCVDDKLIYEVVYSVESDRLLSVYNTIDDFIRNLRIALESLNGLGR
ncbi:KEOPS complex subunit Pcc1 [Vulcanisaeta sp. JCM 14467]|uniref:KEOPS complex subunit Pcc1 n=1 Tax=Vulcanisaeta sp. JCM 14467 TaxID=1295370 RepID=UPI0006D0A0D7|nr:KEOPS complex subunit Pcc1 [Vulcanisaeta sp. JCM 14467]